MTEFVFPRTRKPPWSWYPKQVRSQKPPEQIPVETPAAEPQQISPDQTEQIQSSEPQPVQDGPPEVTTEQSRVEPTEAAPLPDRPQRKKRKKRKGKQKMPRKLRTALERTPPELSHHRRRCLVCRHPDREAIEQEFLHWRNPGGSMGISICYDIPERSIFHHAHATGLFARRARKLRFALECLIERAEDVPLTAEAVIRAVRAHTCLTSNGRWIEPASRVLFSVNREPATLDAPVEMAPPKSLASLPARANHPEPDSLPVTTE